MNPLRRLIIPALLLLIIIVFAVFGYQYIEGWSFTEALYMVVITLSTVGFREVHELSTAGRFLTIAVIVFGVGTVAFTVGQLIEMMVEGQVMGFRRRRKMKQRISEMKGHYIICGFGRVGHQIAKELKASKIPFVVIDSKSETAAELEPQDTPYIVGDITSDAVLGEAGIKQAKGLISSADSDVANVFVTLSARVLNPKLYIIARAGTVDAEEKMKKAGANRVISPYFIAGKRMAQMVTKPVAVDFLDTVLHSEHLEMEMREFKVTPDCTLAGKTLGEADIRRKSGAFVMTILKNSGTYNLQPMADTRVEAGDILVAIGTPGQLDLLQRCLHW